MIPLALSASSRVVRVVSLAARARAMTPGDELVVSWPLAEGVPWRERLAALCYEADYAVSAAAPGAFTDEALARDAEQAGLRLVRREGRVVTLRRDAELPVRGRAALGLRDGARCVALVIRAESMIRREPSPAQLFAVARAVGARARAGVARTELRADLALLEPLVPGRRGCLRRVVAEVLGSPEAAREPVVLGLTPHATGHASFQHSTPWAPRHPVTFVVPAEG